VGFQCFFRSPDPTQGEYHIRRKQGENNSEVPQSLNFQNSFALPDTIHYTIFIFRCEAVLQTCIKNMQVFKKKMFQNNMYEFSLMRRKICF